MTQNVDDRLSEFDREYRNRCFRLAGIDEAGRGPLAGPVVAAAVILPENHTLKGLNDSKKLTARSREKLYPDILKIALVGIGVVGEKEIDEINIYQATRCAMAQAVQALPEAPDFLLIDGNMKLDLVIPQKAIVKGDQKSASIAAASIVAKVFRDQKMQELDQKYPEYFFAKHKGYATSLHLEKIKAFGPCPAHRFTFEPVSRNYSEEFFREKQSV